MIKIVVNGRVVMRQVSVHEAKTHRSRLLRLSRFEGLAVSHMHALAVAELPPHHRDPLDRILVAQARFEGLTPVTAGSAIEPYDVTLIRL